MNVPGTNRQKFKVVLNAKFENGDILSSPGIKGEICNKSIYPKYETWLGDLYEYTMLRELEGEELEIAITHFKFLRKYNLA